MRKEEKEEEVKREKEKSVLILARLTNLEKKFHHRPDLCLLGRCFAPSLSYLMSPCVCVSMECMCASVET